MTYLEFETFLSESNEYLKARIESSKAQFGIMDFPRYVYDLRRGEIWWGDIGAPQIRGRLTVIGTISTKSNTWLWSWANPHFSDVKLGDIDKVREFGEHESIAKLTEEKWEAEEIDGWEMTALSARLLEAEGAYRPPDENGFLFLLYDRLEHIPADELEQYMPLKTTMLMNSKTLDNSTKASNQGGVVISRFEYARYHAAGIFSFLGLYLASWLPLSLKSLKALNGGFRWVRAKEWFLYGDNNPAIVIDTKDGLVAAFTDLDGQLEKRFPVIKLFHEKLHLLGSPVQDGDRFAAISVYGRDDNTAATGRWSSFFPIVVDCVSRDRSRCATARARIPESHWRALEEGLKQLPSMREPGVYDVVLPPDIMRAL